MNENYSEIYTNFLEQIEDKIISYIPKIEPSELYQPFGYIMSAGGKRIRPVLAMICAGAVGGNPETALNAGIASEILHNFTLVHDDIMDESPMRRNRETIHKKWNEPIAILTGDLMVGYAFRLLPTKSESNYSDEIIRTFSDGLIEVCEGQAFDMQFNERKDVTIDEYLLMITKKTARLLETSAVIGGYCGNANQEQIIILRNYANAIGLAFQLQDDLLDLTAEEAELGKKIGQDIFEGKKTYMLLKALELVKDEKDILLLNKFISENGLDYSYVPAIKELFNRIGVLEDAQKKIDFYFNKALKEIEQLPKNKYSDMLIWMISKLNKRKY
jgi:geranylgeranyl diphosphate synthase type II